MLEDERRNGRIYHNVFKIFNHYIVGSVDEAFDFRNVSLAISY